MWSCGPVALGHRRLTIIDLTDTASQPMIDEEHQLALTFNGCIYNYRELRADLARRGHHFRSTSDTEVVLKAYVEWGEQSVERLIGMFAFALADRRSGDVLLVRDRLGIKPLYLARFPGGIRFASTLPALLAAGGVDTQLDPVGLHHFFSWHSIVPAPRTLLRGVEQLPPATVRRINSAGEHVDRTYWRPSFTRHVGAEWSDAEWQERLLDALRTAVRRRTVADVPVGVLLSGGVDSSLIVALLAEHGSQPVPTFSIGFESAGSATGDEFRWSDQVAQTFGTDHERIRIPAHELIDALPAVVEAMSEPMASHDVVAFHLLSSHVSRHCKVVQSGQGADEVFAGYDYHQPFDSIPRDAVAATFRDVFADATHDDIERCLLPDFRSGRDVSTELVEQLAATDGADSAVDALLRLELLTFMPDDPVKRVDNMTMAWGVEARVPFLDHELVELAAAAPPRLKLSQGGKGVLKDIARPLLPEGLVDRPKGYFPVPAVSRLDGALLEVATEVLRSPEAKQRGVFDLARVEELLTDPQRRFTQGNRDRVWQFAVLEMWLQRQGIR
jgi:asparagine synthase (glutamine-hydrolysing)